MLFDVEIESLGGHLKGLKIFSRQKYYFVLIQLNKIPSQWSSLNPIMPL